MRTGWLPGHQYGSFVRVPGPGRGSMVHGYAHGPGGGRDHGVLTGLPRPGPVVCSLVRLVARAGDLRTEFETHKKGRGGESLPPDPYLCLFWNSVHCQLRSVKSSTSMAGSACLAGQAFQLPPRNCSSLFTVVWNSQLQTGGCKRSLAISSAFGTLVPPRFRGF